VTASQEGRPALDRLVLVLAFITINRAFRDIAHEPETHELGLLGAPCVVVARSQFVLRACTYWLTYWGQGDRQFAEMQMVPFTDFDAAVMALQLGDFQWRD